MRRFFSALVLALFAATAVAVPAQAHAELKSSNPASGAALDALPPQIELTFSEVVSLPDGDAVTITGPDGAEWPITQSNVVDKTITAKFDTTAAKAGAHTLAWKAQSEDGDVVQGTFTFTMNVAAQPSSEPPPSSVTMSAPVSNAPPSTSTPSESGGVPAWLWIVVVLIVLIGVILLVRRRKP